LDAGGEERSTLLLDLLAQPASLNELNTQLSSAQHCVLCARQALFELNRVHKMVGADIVTQLLRRIENCGASATGVAAISILKLLLHSKEIKRDDAKLARIIMVFALA
jgi:hypothetical protein